MAVSYKQVSEPQQFATPEAVSRSRRLADSLVQSGLQENPNMTHWTQALGKVLQTGVGALRNDFANADEREAKSDAIKGLATALAGGGFEQAMANPYSQGQAIDMQVADRKRAAQQAQWAQRQKMQADEWQRRNAITNQQSQDNLRLQHSLRQEALQNGAGSSPTFGRSGQIFQDANGNFFTVQFGSNGERRILPVKGGEGEALEPSRGVQWIDDGMTQTPVSKAMGAPATTAAPIQNRPGDVEAAKVAGRETAEGQFALPKLRRGLEMQEHQTEAVTGSIDKAIELASQFGTTGFVGDWTQSIAGTPAHDLQQTLNMVRANLGFDKLQSIRDNSPTGGALGQVAVQELLMLQSVWSSVQQSQTAQQLTFNLKQIRDLQDKFLKMKQDAYRQDVARFGAENVPDVGGGSGGGAPAPNDLKSKYGLE